MASSRKYQPMIRDMSQIPIYALILVLWLVAACGTGQAPPPSPTRTTMSPTDTPVPPTALPPTHTSVPDIPEPADLTSLTGAYLGQNPPGKTPRIFAPGIISVDTNFEHSAAVFSPDYREVFWCTNVDWYTDQRVPGNQRLYHMKLIDGTWTAPQIAPFTENIHVPVQRPVFAPDGNKLYIEYGSNPNHESDSDIYVVERIGEGWSEPVPVSPLINSPAMERLHCVTADGSLYFSRDPFTTNEEIFVSRLVNGAFTEPEKLGESYNSHEYEVAILIAPNEEYMLIEQMDTQHTSARLTISYKRADGSWSDRIAAPYECGGFLALSPDGDYLFFLGEGIYWVDTSFVEDLKPPAVDRLPEASQATISVDTADQVKRLRILSGHSDRVHSVAFSPDGALLASGSGDGTIKLWDIKSGQEVKNLGEAGAGVWDVAFSSDGAILVSRSNGTVTLWGVESGREMSTLGGDDTHKVISVALSPDGALLASGGMDHTLRLWDAESGQVLHIFRERDFPVWGVTFSPDGTLLTSAVGGDTDDCSIKLWNVENGQDVHTLSGHGRYVYSTAFSPDGALLASASGDRTIKLWDVESGQEVRTLTGHKAKVVDVAFSPDGALLVSGSAQDSAVKLWDVESGQELRTFRHGDEVMAVAFSPDGTLLASGGYDNQIYVWGVSR